MINNITKIIDTLIDLYQKYMDYIFIVLALPWVYLALLIIFELNLVKKNSILWFLVLLGMLILNITIIHIADGIRRKYIK